MRKWGFALFAAAVVACGGSTSQDSSECDAGDCTLIDANATGGSGGVGGNGGVGGGGFGGGGVGGGTGGQSSLCEQACNDLGAAPCPEHADVSGCIQACTDAYKTLPQCTTELDVLTSCVIEKAVISCDESGQAQYSNAEDVCASAYQDLFECQDPVGGCNPDSCPSWTLGGILAMDACCPGPAGQCGALIDATIEQLAGVPQGCYAPSQPGNLDCGCPPRAFQNPLSGELEEHPGCCRPSGECGIWVDLTEAEGPVLGCIADATTPAPACSPGPPDPCN